MQAAWGTASKGDATGDLSAPGSGRTSKSPSAGSSSCLRTQSALRVLVAAKESGAPLWGLADLGSKARVLLGHGGSGRVAVRERGNAILSFLFNSALGLFQRHDFHDDLGMDCSLSMDRRHSCRDRPDLSERAHSQNRPRPKTCRSGTSPTQAKG